MRFGGGHRSRHGSGRQIIVPQRSDGPTWVPSRALFKVGKKTIPGGMVYIGSRTKNVGFEIVDPCLIDCSLYVNWRDPDWAGETLDYWPSYNTATPEARSAYLEWLAGGRRDADVGIGHVLLFFYGLERRVLTDLADGSDVDKLDEVADEVRALDGIYGQQRAFHKSALGLLELIESLKCLSDDPIVPEWDRDLKNAELPGSVRAGIGRISQNGDVLSAEWALSYLWNHPDHGLRMPARRCGKYFDDLFKIRYKERYGAGLAVKRARRNVSFSYRPASLGHRSSAAIHTDVPDSSQSPSPFDKLKDLGAECADELDGLSRLLGQDPSAGGTAKAVSLLPEALLQTHGGELAAEMSRWCSTVIDGGSSGAAVFSDVVDKWMPDRGGELTKREAVFLAGFLGHIGIGIEPDVRFGARTPKGHSPVVLFRLPQGAGAGESAEYAAALALVHLAALVAAADGNVSDVEQRQLASHAENVLGLDDAEKARLKAHFALLSADSLGMGGLDKKIAAIGDDNKEQLGDLLVDIAAADGVISTGEISVLERIFGSLGLGSEQVYSRLHDATTNPFTKEQETGGEGLNHDRIMERLSETAQAAELLETIFEDDDEVAPFDSTPDTYDGQAIEDLDLDGAHSLLAGVLSERELWNRCDAEAAARSAGIEFLGGAMDVINEASIDSCGEPLIEGDDPLWLNRYAADEVLGR